VTDGILSTASSGHRDEPTPELKYTLVVPSARATSVAAPSGYTVSITTP
jgi:hypothetical protein